MQDARSRGSRAVPAQRRPIFVDLGRIVDRNACPWRESTVLVRVAVDGVFEQITAYAAVVEQRVALTGCSITDDLLALGAAVEQESQELVADSLSPGAGWHAALARNCSGIHRRLDAQARDARIDRMLQQAIVVAGDFDHKRVGTESEAFGGVIDEPPRVLDPDETYAYSVKVSSGVI